MLKQGAGRQLADEVLRVHLGAEGLLQLVVAPQIAEVLVLRVRDHWHSTASRQLHTLLLSL